MQLNSKLKTGQISVRSPDPKEGKKLSPLKITIYVLDLGFNVDYESAINHDLGQRSDRDLDA